MNKKLTSILFLSLFLILTGCQKTETICPIPPIEIEPEVSPLKVQHKLGIIGGIEPIYILPIAGPFQARIDTGAQTSSLDATDIELFERDGEKWISFTLTNNETGEKHIFEKELLKKVAIKRTDDLEKRYVVNMTVKFGGEILTVPFTLINRDKFDYQILVGRNILTGLAVVDTAIKNTLK